MSLVILMLTSWVPVLLWLIYLYVASNVPGSVSGNAPRLPLDGQVFGHFLQTQEVFVFLITVFAGAGLIANDLRSGGILMYLSRPLTLRDYLVGKVSALVGLQLAVTLVPGLLLYAAALALTPERFAAWNLAWIAPALVLQSALIAGILSLLALAVSSIARSPRLAGLIFFGVLAVTDVLAAGLGLVLGHSWPALISVRALLWQVDRALFGITESAPTLHWGIALAELAALAAGSLYVLRARIRAVEIVR